MPSLDDGNHPLYRYSYNAKTGITMDKRHDDALTNRLEEIITDGVTYISWNELYLWYDTEKIAAGTYRDLHARWGVMAKKHKPRTGKPFGVLTYVQALSKTKPGIYLFGSNMAHPLENPDA